MLTIHDGEALPRAFHPSLRELIKLRVSQLRSNYDGPMEEIVCFYVVEAGDGQEQVTEALGFSPLQNLVDGTTFGDPGFEPSFEWISCHGLWFELVFILTDDGFGHILFVPNDPGTEFDLHSLCLEYACRCSN
ncbi:hypothetical protein [Sphingomonas glaciei]|uniref:DUF1963 domain-containing protein n=1 Tax=Sphingomonas glaciei TaxID=2938948 RepID=A0ABY5MUD9_9SPHN|nr:hypothetical protein [Sphingomonas glaciei]UUR07581.1 hypothetical protein M1K48_11655 [Sphingomonas glaciei]